MEKIFDHEAYKNSYSHRIAYVEGKLDLCEELIQLTHIILANTKISPFKPTTDFEEGQMAAFSAILENLAVIQRSAQTQGIDESSVIFDA